MHSGQNAYAFPMIYEEIDSTDLPSQLFQSLLNHMEGMAYYCRLDSEWVMTYVSEGCEALTGYPQVKMINTDHYESVVHPDDKAMVHAHIHYVVANHRRVDIQYRIKKANGLTRWVWERAAVIYDEHGKAEALEGFIEDITDKRQAELRYRSIFDHAIEGIFQTTIDGKYLSANPALAKMYAYETPEELIASLNDIGHTLYVDPTRRDEFIAKIEATGEIRNFESQIYRRDKGIIWISENARIVKDENEQFLYYEGTVEDITERVTHEKILEFQATHDAVTGLPNRNLLQDRLQHGINLAERTAQKLAVIFIDLDKFKDVNDSLGHQAGDQLLITMSERFMHCVRDSDTVARIGGDEFVVLLTNPHDENAVHHTLSRILQVISQPCSLGNWDFTVTCSIGISMYPEHGTSSETLMKNADAAMYKAKHAGKNNYQFFNHSLNANIVERLEMERGIGLALANDEFTLHYQPKVSLKTGKITGMEALIRWQSAKGGAVPPAKFIPIAEGTHLIEEIGTWVLKHASNHIFELNRTLKTNLPVAINVAARQFQQIGFVDSIENLLITTGIPPHLLQIEITESSLMKDTAALIKLLEELKQLGIKIAIDDFGTGYSSMAYLKNFPIDYLKIDRAFITHLEDGSKEQAILRAIISLGHNLGLKVIAEGVETQAQFDFLNAINCDEIQGYYFSKPLPLNELRDFIQSPAITMGSNR